MEVDHAMKSDRKPGHRRDFGEDLQLVSHPHKLPLAARGCAKASRFQDDGLHKVQVAKQLMDHTHREGHYVLLSDVWFLKAAAERGLSVNSQTAVANRCTTN